MNGTPRHLPRLDIFFLVTSSVRVKTPLIAVFGALFATLSVNTAGAVDYNPFNSPFEGSTVITGIRGASAVPGDVVITGSYILPDESGNTAPLIYQGSLISDTAGTWTVLTPSISGQQISTATLYGPNTGYYDPALGSGGIRAVGSYKYSTGGEGNHGLMFTRIDNVDTWSQFDVPTSLTGGTPVLNTIAHSTMGNLVVGNYDTQLNTGNAFVYDISTQTFSNFQPVPQLSITAYGIWKNSDDSYTVAGGYSDIANGVLSAGFIVDYHPDSALPADRYANFTTFQYNNLPANAVISHFDGIVASADGYHLTGDHITLDEEEQFGFFAAIKRNEDGSFGAMQWTSINYPGADITSGNTVYGETTLGVYASGDTSSSYTATIPEPSTIALIASLPLLGLASTLRRLRRAS